MNVEIAQRLAARRKQAGLSQEALAERLGVSRQAVSKWERSESSPDTDNLIALAQLYGVSLDDLLYVDDEIRDDVVFEAADRAVNAGVGTANTVGAASVAAATDASAAGVSGTTGASAAGATAGATTGATTGATGASAAGATSSAMPGAADPATCEPQASEADPTEKKVHVGLDGIHVKDGEDYVHLTWRDGIHVKDSKKDDEVHVGWDGVHVKEGPKTAKDEGDWFVADTHGFAAADDEGNEVHVSSDGVIINGEYFDSWQEAHAKYGYGHMHGDRWGEPCVYEVFDEEFSTIEEARAKYGPEVGKSIPVRKRYLRSFEKAWVKFPYPLVVILAYILMGVFMGTWGMGLFLFLTIPVYYILGAAIGRRRIAPFVASVYPICAIGWFCYMAFVMNAAHPAWVIFLTIPVVEWLVVALSHWWKKRKRQQSAAENGPINVEAKGE